MKSNEKEDTMAKIRRQLVMVFPELEGSNLLDIMLPCFKEFKAVSVFESVDGTEKLVYKSGLNIIEISRTNLGDNIIGYLILNYTDDNILDMYHVYNRELDGIYSQKIEKHENGLVILDANKFYKKGTNEVLSIKYHRYVCSYDKLELKFPDVDFKNMELKDIEEYLEYFIIYNNRYIDNNQNPEIMLDFVVSENKLSRVIDNPDILVRDINKYSTVLNINGQSKYDGIYDLSSYYSDCKNLEEVEDKFQLFLNERTEEENSIIGEVLKTEIIEPDFCTTSKRKKRFRKKLKKGKTEEVSEN